MKEMIIETVLKVGAEIIIMLIGAIGTAVLARLSKQQKLTNVALATEELLGHTQTTVMELEQVYVNRWKAASEDGKLTEGEKQQLHALLLDGAKAKLSEASYKILSAAGTDMTNLILGAGEAVLARIRG